jgi:acyl carrier protein
MSDILAELNPIFRDVLDQPELQIVRASNASTVEGWDSLAHINLVSSIEKQYKIRFALGELEGLKNVGEMVDLIAVKLGKR